MKFSDKTHKITIVLIVTVLAAVFVSLVWNNNVWMDEAFSASLVHTDFAQMLERSMADTLPPLYNILLWTMTTVFGYSVPVMKITSVIPMILTLILGATVVRRRFGERTSILFMLFTAFMPLMMYFGVEIRMYSLGFFFATAAGVYAYEAGAEPSSKNYALLCIFTALSGYTHHFALVTAGFAYLYLLLLCIFRDRERLKNWLLCLLGVFVLYLPCFVVTLRQFSRVSGYFSMPDIDLHTFIQYSAYPYVVGITAASVLCVLLMICSLALLFSKLVIKRNADAKTVYAAFCFAVYYCVLLFGTILCKVMSANIFVDRYLFFSTGLLWLSAAIVLSEDRRVFIAGLAASLIIGICGYSVRFTDEYKNSADEEIAFFRENIKEGDIYFSIGGHEEMQNCIPFYTYLDEETPDLTFVYPLENAVKTSQDQGTTLWLSVLDGFSPSDEDLAILEKYGLAMEKQADLDFDRYKCGFYKVMPRSFVKK